MSLNFFSVDEVAVFVKTNFYGQLALGACIFLIMRAAYLSYDDSIHMKNLSQPQRERRIKLSKRPRGMRLSDWPEYALSVLLLGISGRWANIPLEFVLLFTFGAFLCATYLHRPVQRFRYMWRLAFFNWVLVIFYSKLTQFFVPTCHWSFIISGYIGVLTSFYLWHVLAHQPWTGQMYKVHMHHHMKQYPPGNYVSETHFPTHSFISWEGLNHEGPLYSMTLIMLCILRILYPLSSINAFVFLVFGIFIVGYLGNQLHYAFHIKDHWLEQFEWFCMIRELHWIHHKGDFKTNYMLVNFVLDEVFDSKDYVRPVSEKFAFTKKARNSLHSD